MSKKLKWMNMTYWKNHDPTPGYMRFTTKKEAAHTAAMAVMVLETSNKRTFLFDGTPVTFADLIRVEQVRTEN